MSTGQYLEYKDDLLSNASQWHAVYTKVPITPVSRSITDEGATNRNLYYRIRAERQ